MFTGIVCVALLTFSAYAIQINQNDLSPTPMHFLEAEVYCRSLGRNLYTPRANEAVPMAPEGKAIWMNLRRKSGQITRWIDGNRNDVTDSIRDKWANGQPDNYEGKEFCGHIIAGSNLLGDFTCESSAIQSVSWYAWCV